MHQPTLEDLERTAREYDTRLGPTLFAPWAGQTVAQAHLRPGDRVLDVACGTGAVAIKAAQQVGPDGRVTGLDLNPGMLAVAESKSDTITWVQGSAESLPFGNDFFDAVLCQFGLMLFPDPVNELGEMYRVLKPGRHLVVTLFDSLDNLPVYRILADTYGQVVGKAVGELLRVPFSLGDRRGVHQLFVAAAITDTELLTRQGNAHFASVRDLVLADIRGWFPFAGVTMTDERTEAVIEAAERALADFIAPDGCLTFPVSAHLVIATKRPQANHRGNVVI